MNHIEPPELPRVDKLWASRLGVNRLIMIAVIGAVMLVPLGLIRGTLEERAERHGAA